MILWIKGHLNKWGLQPPNPFRLTFVTLPSNLSGLPTTNRISNYSKTFGGKGIELSIPSPLTAGLFPLKLKGQKCQGLVIAQQLSRKQTLIIELLCGGRLIMCIISFGLHAGGETESSELSFHCQGSLCSVSNLKGKNRASGNNSGAFLFSE